MMISIYYVDFEKLLSYAKPKTIEESAYLSYCKDSAKYARKFKTAIFMELKELHLLESFCVIEPTETLNDILSRLPDTTVQTKSINSRPDLVPVTKGDN